MLRSTLPSRGSLGVCLFSSPSSSDSFEATSKSWVLSVPLSAEKFKLCIEVKSISSFRYRHFLVFGRHAVGYFGIANFHPYVTSIRVPFLDDFLVEIESSPRSFVTVIFITVDSSDSLPCFWVELAVDCDSARWLMTDSGEEVLLPRRICLRFICRLKSSLVAKSISHVGHRLQLSLQVCQYKLSFHDSCNIPFLSSVLKPILVRNSILHILHTTLLLGGRSGDLKISFSCVSTLATTKWSFELVLAIEEGFWKWQISFSRFRFLVPNRSEALMGSSIDWDIFCGSYVWPTPKYTLLW